MYSTQSFDRIFCRFSHLLSPPFRVNMVTTKGKKPETTEENIMNAKTERQIENLKKQTIGVEIEMNHITRKNAIIAVIKSAYAIFHEPCAPCPPPLCLRFFTMTIGWDWFFMRPQLSSVGLGFSPHARVLQAR